MKIKATMRDIKASNHIVLGVSYCELQAILNYESPIAYSAGANGWNCDLYRINDTYSIVTGYNYSRSCNSDLYSNKNAPLKLALKKIENVANQWNREERLKALISVLDEHFNK